MALASGRPGPVRAIAFIVALALLSAGTGRLALQSVRDKRWNTLEMALLSVALGLGFCGYAVFLLGLLGRLNLTAVSLAAFALTVPAAFGLRALARDAAEQRALARETKPLHPANVLAGAVLLILALIALVDCFVPPAGREWDSLSYHLAAPMAFLDAGRILSLPTDHHSYFPFLTQMLFTVGLLFDGFAAAKLVHLFMGVIAVCAIYATGKRWLTGQAGWAAALIFALTPMVVWEAGVAYIELAQTAYVVLALHAALLYRDARTAGSAAALGAMSGLALAAKTLSLIPVAAFAVLFLLTSPRLRHVLLCAGAILVLGAPFYARTWALTGNPVYPFAYSVFGGKYWDAHRARLYASEHTSFGLDGQLPAVGDDLAAARKPYTPPGVSDRLRNAVLAPFSLVSLPRLFHNYNDPTPFGGLGFLALALVPLALLSGDLPRRIRDCAFVAAVWYLVWLLSMQYSRYLIPMLPLAALVGAAGWRSLARRARLIRWCGYAAFVVQAAILLSHSVPRSIAQAQLIRSPGAAEEYLRRQVNVYDSQQWLNQNTRQGDGVVLFEETRSYYLRRPVLWGNSPHSTYIPYDRFGDGDEMARWFVEHGTRYALVNLRYAPNAATTEGVARLRESVRSHMEAGVLMDWYTHADPSGEPWRPLLADAIRRGAATYVDEASSAGAVVLRLSPAQERIGR